ncbi:hypothetical protein [Streptomyces viridosporus]|uniref:hypothetical protein n=1 Tax=Streptomyces viridosporus TaxID=67581 RepID=UPI0002E22D11|nr:hypothetical protein [Streptomyces viridosporus]
MGSLLNGVVLLIKHDTGLLQGEIDVVEIRIIVRDRLQAGLRNLRSQFLSKVVIFIPRPLSQRSEFGFQSLNATCGMVGNLLGGVPLLLRTSQLLAQVGLLPLCTR